MEIILPHVSGKVVNVNGSEIVVAQLDGLNVTVNTSGSTYNEAGASVPASDVQTGTVVSVTGTLSSDHDEIDATTIEIVLPTLTGTVTGVSGSTITMTTAGGTSETVTTGTDTVFRNASGATEKIASVTKGDFVEVSGTPGSGDTFAAVAVTIGPSISIRPILPGGAASFGSGRVQLPANAPSGYGFASPGSVAGPASWATSAGA